MPIAKTILKSLLPKGAFWEMKRQSAMDRLLSGLSLEFDRIHEILAEIFDFLSATKSEARLRRLFDLKGESSEVISLLLSRGGDLSLTYIEKRLKALGYSHFKISDPTEDDLGLEPIVDLKKVGMIYVSVKVDQIIYLSAGDSCGSPIRQWEDTAFENEIKKLMPAHLQVQFFYQSKELTYATSQSG